MKKMPVFALASVLAASMLGLVGCGGPSVEEVIREDITAELDSVTPDNADIIAAVEADSGEDLDMFGITAEDFTREYLDGFAYEITGIDVDDEGGVTVAHVRLTCKSMNSIIADFEPAFEEAFASVDIANMTEEDAYKLGGEVMIECLKNAEPRDVDVDIKYVETSEGEWSIDPSAENELMSALMG